MGRGCFCRVFSLRYESPSSADSNKQEQATSDKESGGRGQGLGGKLAEENTRIGSRL